MIVAAFCIISAVLSFRMAWRLFRLGRRIEERARRRGVEVPLVVKRRVGVPFGFAALWVFVLLRTGVLAGMGSASGFSGTAMAGSVLAKGPSSDLTVAVFVVFGLWLLSEAAGMLEERYRRDG